MRGRFNHLVQASQYRLRQPVLVAVFLVVNSILLNYCGLTVTTHQQGMYGGKGLVDDCTASKVYCTSDQIN